MPQLNNCMENDTQLTISDLHLLKQIIEISSTRGCWQASELAAVGEVYNKLNAFLMQGSSNDDKPEPQPEVTQGEENA